MNYLQKGYLHRGGISIDEEILVTHANINLIPITIDYTSQIAKIPKGTLYGRQTASPGKYVPFMTLAKIASATNTTNFIATMETALEAGIFTITTDKIKLWDVDAGALIGVPSTGIALTVDIVDTSAGTVTCTGETVDCTPAAGDLLVITDGSELDEDIVVILEEIDFSVLTADIHTYALYEGMVKETKIKRLWDEHTTPNCYITKTDVQRINFHKPQI